MSESSTVPAKAWIVTFAGTAVNLCLGILYAWSVWKKALIASADHVAGSAMTGLNQGWVYLTDTEGTLAYVVCGIAFSLFMIPGGRLQDKYGPRLCATLGGLLLAGGCILAGLLRSYSGLILGFGVLGGMGMGMGYAAATPAAVKWFGPHKRGLIVGLVVGGFGAAAIYISPLATYLIDAYGISGSFIGLGIFFACVVIVAGQALTWPPAGYQTLAAPASRSATTTMTQVDWPAGKMLKTWQFYALVFLFVGSSQSGLLVIANATPILNTTAKSISFFAVHAWILASFGGLINAAGRIGTGLYSDRVGRANAFLLNGLVSAVCLFFTPAIIRSENILLLFIALGVAYWQYGGALSLMPAFTADYFGSKNLGMNYGLVFLGWGIGFVIPLIAGVIKDAWGSLDAAFYLSGSLLTAAVVLSRFLRRPEMPASPAS